jgi:hypothetical protein
VMATRGWRELGGRRAGEKSINTCKSHLDRIREFGVLLHSGVMIGNGYTLSISKS